MVRKTWQVCAVTAGLLVGCATGAAVTSAAPAAGAVSTPFAISGALLGVAATSSTNAWAVGTAAHGGGLIVRWNGVSWRRQSAPRGRFDAVTAVSARNAWAVGTARTGRALIAHWNGHAWRRVNAPSPRRSAELLAVTAASAANVWAVGWYFAAHITRSLILHWNGTTWRQQIASGMSLFGVAATSARNAWAVGSTFDAPLNATRATVLHWDGHSWRRVPSPAPVGNGAVFRGVTAARGRTPWAVGCWSCAIGGFSNSLTERWNGRRWTRVRSTPPGAAVLSAVAARSNTSRTMWAVGGRYVGGNSLSLRTVAEHWNGRRWQQVRTPSPGSDAALNGVAVLSARNAWAVGSSARSGSTSRTLIIHWNGSSWR